MLLRPMAKNVLTIEKRIIFFKRSFITMFTYTTYKIPLTPEFPSPQLPLYRWQSLKYLSCCYALNCLNHFVWTVRWNSLEKKMHMVPIYSNLQKYNLIPFGYLYTNIAKFLIHILAKNHLTILRRAYKMIDQYRNIVPFVDIFAHVHYITTKNLRSKLRGIQPEEIKLPAGGC